MTSDSFRLLLATYLVGAVVFCWAVWWYEERLDFVQIAIVLIWPIAIVIATARQLLGHYDNGDRDTDLGGDGEE